VGVARHFVPLPLKPVGDEKPSLSDTGT
jgi:hypothetical protein